MATFLKGETYCREKRNKAKHGNEKSKQFTSKYHVASIFAQLYDEPNKTLRISDGAGANCVEYPHALNSFLQKTTTQFFRGEEADFLLGGKTSVDIV